MAERTKKESGKVSRRAHGLRIEDIRLIRSALWDAQAWQESIVSAHTLGPGEQTPELTREAMKARRLSLKYLKLLSRLRGKRKE